MGLPVPKGMKIVDPRVVKGPSGHIKTIRGDWDPLGSLFATDDQYGGSPNPKAEILNLGRKTFKQVITRS